MLSRNSRGGHISLQCDRWSTTTSAAAHYSPTAIQRARGAEWTVRQHYTQSQAAYTATATLARGSTPLEQAAAPSHSRLSPPSPLTAQQTHSQTTLHGLSQRLFRTHLVSSVHIALFGLAAPCYSLPLGDLIFRTGTVQHPALSSAAYSAHMVLQTLTALANELLSFTPSDFHWPTAIITAVLVTACYYTNQLIANAVSTSTATNQPPPDQPTQPSAPIEPIPPPTFEPSNLLDFYLLLGRLKTTKRTGWLDHNVPNPESIADHMYRLTLIYYTLLPHTTNTKQHTTGPTSTNGTVPPQPPQPQPLLMSLTHDMAECIAGDITPTEYSGVSKADKHQRETDALHSCLSHLPTTQRTEVDALWHEYEADESEASRLLHDCDKLEMIVQAFEYEREEHRRKRGSVAGLGGLEGRRRSIGSWQKPLDRFYESVKRIRNERVRQVAHEVMRRRHKELLDGSAADRVGCED